MAERKRKGGGWKRRPVLPADAGDRLRALDESSRSFGVVVPGVVAWAVLREQAAVEDAGRNDSDAALAAEREQVVDI